MADPGQFLRRLGKDCREKKQVEWSLGNIELHVEPVVTQSKPVFSILQVFYLTGRTKNILSLGDFQKRNGILEI